MTLPIPKMFDAYSLRARQLPALLTILPVLITVACLFPDVYKSAGAAIASIAVSCGVLLLFAQIARHLGRTQETRLFEKWGGIPTTAWLRHRDGSLDKVTKGRYHKFLVKHVPRLKLPSEEEERRLPSAADDAYRSATKWLIEHTRDKKRYPLVFEENVTYGFQRNTFALKSAALPVALACLAAVALFIYAKTGLDVRNADPGAVLLLIVLLVDLGIWVMAVTENWVRDAAHAYARAVLAVCDA